MAATTVIIGVGNPGRRDDGAGLAAVRRLTGTLPAGMRVVAREGHGAALIDDWQGASRIVLIDAMSSRSAPGTIRRYAAHERPLPSTFSRASTHAFGVAEAIELARAIGRLPARVIVFGIEGRDFGHGEGLSPEVDAAVDQVVRHIVDEAGGAARLESRWTGADPAGPDRRPPVADPV